jgi:hypothetical protein
VDCEDTFENTQTLAEEKETINSPSNVVEEEVSPRTRPRGSSFEATFKTLLTKAPR